ncbi:MAG: hypothetical protein N2506_06850 [Dehalococcoidales bacterium]|nr:hypothetical protein [Dehalococcoidales bacterium]
MMDKYMVRSCPNCGGTVYRYFSLYKGWREECFGCGYQSTSQQKPVEAALAGNPSNVKK